MDRFEQLVTECETDIRAGHIARAARRLSALNTAEVPLPWILKVANVCRRAGLINQGLRLLSPIVRAEKSAQTPPTDNELSEYAALLHRCGASTESLQVINQINSDRAPEALLYKVFGLFSMWDYEAAIPVLQEYLLKEKSPYMQMVGRLNQASALVSSGRYDNALSEVTGLIELARNTNAGRLQSNAHELRAQVHIHKRQFTQAREDLETAARLVPDSRAFDSFLVRKWRAVLSAFEERDEKPLLKLRREALEKNDWESAREADRFRLAVSFDANVFEHLYFGTPFPKYRALITRELSRAPESTEYIWGDRSVSIFDVVTGTISGRLGGAKRPTQKCHQLIDLLTRDFYRGMRIGALFSELYKDEYFDIFSSPGRVRRILNRTRAWAKQNRVPLHISEAGGFYSMDRIAGFGVKVALNREQVDGFSRQWEELRRAFANQGGFTSQQARERLGMTRTSLQRLVSWALEAEKIEAVGSGSSVHYQIAETMKKAA